MPRQLSLAPPAAAPARWSFRAGDAIVPGLHAWSRLGDGRRCETWLAWSVPHWSAVSVKLPRPDHRDPHTARTLAREARVLGPLRHPGLQRLLAVRRRPLPHLVFEYVEGPTLAERIDDGGRLRPGDVVRLGLQLAATLHHLHAHGLAHCDLKPGNVVLRDGRPVLIDLDIARRLGARSRGLKAAGSVEYMAPEQRRGQPAAPTMDLFALGAVLYEAATDEIAFSARRRAKPGAPWSDALRRPRRLVRTLPLALDQAICALLDPDPASRPQTAMAAMALLARALPPGEEGLWPRWAGRLMSPPEVPRLRAAGGR